LFQEEIVIQRLSKLLNKGW